MVLPDGDALEVVEVLVPEGDALVDPVLEPPGPMLLELEVLLLIMLMPLELVFPPGAFDVAVLVPVLTVLSLLLEVGVVEELVSVVPVYAPFAPKV